MEKPDLVSALDALRQSEITVWASKSNRASQIGDPCIRKLVYYRLYPEKQELHTVDLQYIFNEGKIQENALFDDLAKAGYRLTETQRDFNDQRYQLSGHIDGKLSVNGHSWPVEIKSMSPHIWDSVSTKEDLDKYAWTRKYPAQLQVYMLLSNSPEALMLFKNKSTGRVKQLWFELDYEYAEALLQKCEQINTCVSKGELPDRMLNEDCKSCPFHTTCCPESIATSPLDFLDLPDLEKKIEQWESLRDYSLEYDRLNTHIKERLRGIEKAVIGNYLIQGKAIKNGWKTDIKPIEG